jgi:hypothetical protein
LASCDCNLFKHAHLVSFALAQWNRIFPHVCNLVDCFDYHILLFICVVSCQPRQKTVETIKREQLAITFCAEFGRVIGLKRQKDLRRSQRCTYVELLSLQKLKSNDNMAVLNRVRLLGFLRSHFPRCTRSSFLVGSRSSICPCLPIYLCLSSLLLGRKSPQAIRHLDFVAIDSSIRLLQFLLHQKHANASLPLPDMDIRVENGILCFPLLGIWVCLPGWNVAGARVETW